jgi:hypothetical protein
MLHRTVATIFCFAIVALVAAPAAANLPDLTLSSASVPANAVALYSIPDGSGQSFSGAMDATGATVNGTITVTLLNPIGNPIANFPLEDVWLESLDGNLGICVTAHPDAITDGAGQAFFTSFLNAGGNSFVATGGGLRVMVLGSSLVGSDLAYNMLTPDLDNNGAVDLSDTVMFVPLYTGGGYDMSVDFFWDGNINLSDLVLYASGLNLICP